MNPSPGPKEQQRAARLLARRAAPGLSFKHDPNLPITARREEILAALREHPVLIVAGDTGSGKSTQLPQYALELGRGIEGLIAHTQPRRLAARALAARVAGELSQSLGAAVGFRVRFADQVSDATRLVLMTDGLLLAEIHADPLLRRYDTVIVDEAHERTLNVDLLLGVLRRLLPRRPDLKVIVTSATLDVERIARFFDDAPVIAVSGRGHPIEVRYRPPVEDDLPTAVLQAVREIEAEPGAIGTGDVLVFLPGEREIKDVGEFLERELGTHLDVLPLYSRLSWEQQRRIFERGARRRVVLATNVAETSITVPGIRAVIDSGLARISRYSSRTRLQRLPIEPVSRASAEQRKGRCGRVGPGLCIRLYGEEEFQERSEFTEPEILRTNLAALLLRLAADGLGAAEDFPFVDLPDARARGDGYRLLHELGGLDAERRITRRGRAMARLPLDPRLARALLESQRFHAEAELLAIVSGLSVPDPRITQTGAPAEESDEAQSFEDPRSEFSGMIKLWRAYRTAREGTRRDLRRWCTERRLSLLRLSEWDNVYSQVKDRAADLGIVAGSQKASYTAVHRSLLAGFNTMIGVRGEDGVYLGTRGVRFHLFPGSPLRRRKPKWVMAANIVATSRIYARSLAEIQPIWIESAAGPLIQREYLEPDWSEAREEVVARERTTFLGLILSADRSVNYGPIAPEESRRIFAREALVHGRLARRPEWLLANDAAIRAAEQVEERLRTRDLLVDAETLVAFYDATLPRQVSSAAGLEYFTRHLSDAERQALVLAPANLFARPPDPQALAQFPERIELEGVRIAVTYRFAPGEPDDGATLQLPVLAVPRLVGAALDAAIPGFRRPRVDALLRTLPKDARRRLIPIADTVSRYLQAPVVASGLGGLAAWLQAHEGLPANLIQFDVAAIDAHLTPRLLVVEAGRTLAEGRELGTLRRATAARAAALLDELAHNRYPREWQSFAAEELPTELTLDVDAGMIRVFPGLRHQGSQVSVSLHWSAAEAARETLSGATQLARNLLARQFRDLAKHLGADTQLLLAASPFVRGEALIDTLLQIACRRACFANDRVPRKQIEFDAALEQARAGLFDAVTQVRELALAWYTEARALRRLLDDPRARGLGELATESHEHLRRLLDLGSLRSVAVAQLTQVARYLRGAERRWQRLLARGTEPPALGSELAAWNARLHSLETRVAAERRWLPELEDLRWWLEEYRISLTAQELKTARPVSATRLEQRVAEIEAWLRR
jgi:ATP-dependent helicase HrpA